MNDFPKLCYLSGPWAWFTTAPLECQWGDDWDDTPYECNASPPYEWQESMEKKYGVGRYSLTKVAWESPHELPEDRGMAVSVQMLNELRLPWLDADSYIRKVFPFLNPVYAGVSLPKFTMLIECASGRIYR